MTDAIDKTNDAHKVLCARREIRDTLKARIDSIKQELDRIDEYARNNQGRVMHQPATARSAVDVLLDKAATEIALEEAERRVKEAAEDFDKKKAAECSINEVSA